MKMTTALAMVVSLGAAQLGGQGQGQPQPAREVTVTQIPGVTSGGAYYVSPAGQVSTIGDNLRTNGIILSPVRNNAKSIFKLPMLTQGFKGRAK